MYRFSLYLLFAIIALFMNACGGSSSSPALPIPSAPVGVQVVPGGSQVMLGWDTASGANRYHVYWNTTGGVTVDDDELTTGTSTRRIHTGLDNGTTYYYIVTAANSTGESEPSDEKNVTPTSVPQNVRADPGAGVITVSWAPVSDAVSYNIYWNTTGSVTTTDSAFTDLVSLYTHTGLSNLTTYYYIVTSVNKAGLESDPSAEVTALPAVPEVLYVSSAAVDDSGSGTSVLAAKKTIAAAIAVATAPAEIRVAAGTYNVSGSSRVVIADGVSLYGGYSADFSARDPANNITTITNTSAQVTGDIQSPNHAVEAGAGVGAATVIDGFVINGSEAAAADYTTAIWIHDAGAPTVQGNTLDGGNGSSASFGMVVAGSSPLVQDNTLNGGNSAALSFGMYNFDSSFPLVRSNVINGGSGATSTGMFNSTYSSPIVRANTIDSGAGSDISTGLYNHTWSSSVVQNNVIHGGAGIRSFGVRNTSSSPILRNNILFGGGGGSAYGVYNASSSSPAIDNNIIFASEIVSDEKIGSFCIYEAGTGNTPASVRNNDLLYCDILYKDADAKCVANGDSDADLTTCTLAEMELLTDFGTDGVSGNVSEPPLFNDIKGDDNNVSTLADNNWYYSVSSPASVTAGGLNGGDLGWGFTTGKAGYTRPGTGLPWSMGPYEQ